MELLATLRRIRACEGEVAAQLVLEAFVAERAAGRCKTCKHWIPDAVEYPRAEQQRRSERIGIGGYCHSGKLVENWSGEYPIDAVVYPYTEGADAFWTGPEFGCVHHVSS